jgi:hypothetical protein
MAGLKKLEGRICVETVSSRRRSTCVTADRKLLAARFGQPLWPRMSVSEGEGGSPIEVRVSIGRAVGSDFRIARLEAGRME